MELAEAVKARLVTMNAINMEGHYCGKTTNLVVKNTGRDIMQIKVTIGTMLAPDSAIYQPLVVTQEEMLVLQPSVERSVMLQTFCANAPRSCPAEKHHYSYAGIASDTLVTVLKFIKTHSLFGHLGQSGVWAVTNHHDPSSVYDADQDAISKQFIAVICKATGRPLPDYYTVTAPIEQVSGQPAYVPKPLKIIASFVQMLEAPKVLTLGVFDEKGVMIQEVFTDKEFPRAGHEFGVEFEAADVPPGKYFIRLKEGATVLQEKMVKVE